jgi:hypothetical protein
MNLGTLGPRHQRPGVHRHGLAPDRRPGRLYAASKVGTQPFPRQTRQESRGGSCRRHPCHLSLRPLEMLQLSASRHYEHLLAGIVDAAMAISMAEVVIFRVGS